MLLQFIYNNLEFSSVEEIFEVSRQLSQQAYYRIDSFDITSKWWTITVSDFDSIPVIEVYTFKQNPIT
jgi:hypothetical protein